MDNQGTLGFKFNCALFHLWQFWMVGKRFFFKKEYDLFSNRVGALSEQSSTIYCFRNLRVSTKVVG